jgi:hypothetical protein
VALKASIVSFFILTLPGLVRVRQRQDFERLRYATEEAAVFSPIPCWAHLLNRLALFDGGTLPNNRTECH